MNKLITTAAAATLLLAAPLAAFADGRDHRSRGWGHPSHSHSHGWKHGHARQGHWQSAPHVYYPAPRVFVAPPPVFVSVPAPVIAVPAPYPFPHHPGNSVNIGFRLFF